MESKSDKNIVAALNLLENAAEQTKDELQAIMSDGYSNLKSLLGVNDSGLVDSLSAVKDQAIEATTHAKDAGLRKVRDLADDVDQGLHQNPWPYIAGSAAAGLVLGLILGRCNK